MTQQEFMAAANAVQINLSTETWKEIADKVAEEVPVGERAALPVLQLEGVSDNNVAYFANPGLTIQGETYKIETVGQFTVVVAVFGEAAIAALQALEEHYTSLNPRKNPQLKQTINILRTVEVPASPEYPSLEALPLEIWKQVADSRFEYVDPEVRGSLSVAALEGLSNKSAPSLANPGITIEGEHYVVQSVGQLTHVLAAYGDAAIEAIRGLASSNTAYDLDHNPKLLETLNILKNIKGSGNPGEPASLAELPKATWIELADNRFENVDPAQRGELSVDAFEGLSINSAPFLATPGLTINDEKFIIQSTGELATVVAQHGDAALAAIQALADLHPSLDLEHSKDLKATLDILKTLKHSAN